MATRASVLTHSNDLTTARYRNAVAEIIRSLQLTHDLTDLDFAERIGCSIGTVRNARNEESDLGAIWLAKIEKVFGTGSIDPFLRMSGSRSAPTEPDETADALPTTTAAIHKLALARSPDSPGGEAITHCELLDMESAIDAAIKALMALKCRAEKVRAA
jgi:transcriptional regulator with XRE-family HTH domain